jgi:hypothetical protein
VKPTVGRIGGYARAVLRHLARRGPCERGDLFEHFCGNDGAHAWYPEDFDRAISELVDAGLAEEVDSMVRRAVGPPL